MEKILGKFVIQYGKHIDLITMPLSRLHLDEQKSGINPLNLLNRMNDSAFKHIQNLME